MSVRHALLRQERVQHEFDGRIRRCGVDQVGAREANQLRVGDRLAGAQRAKRVEPHGGQRGRFDLGHVGAAGLDVDDFGLFAEHVGRFCLQRSVAAAMQDKLACRGRGVASHKPAAPGRGRCRIWRRVRPAPRRHPRPSRSSCAIWSAAGEAARPPAPAARLFRTFVIADFGDDRLRGGSRLRGCRRRRSFRAGGGRRRLAHR